LDWLHWNKSQEKERLNIATEIVFQWYWIADDFFFSDWQNEAGNKNFQNISWNESLSGYLCVLSF
jgi:hypothetical protein